MNQKEKKRREILYELLSHLDIDKIEVTFDGAGDEGQIDDPVFIRKGKAVELHPDILNEVRPDLVEVRYRSYGQNLPPEGEEVTACCNLQDAISSLCAEMLERRHPGWEINDGSYGCILIEPKTQKTRVEYNERQIHSDISYDDL